MVDSTSTTQGSNYSAKVIDKLPVGRNYADIAFSQPGVQADFGETQGRSLAISVYGSTSSENLFLIDGVNTTNVIKGFQGKDLNTEFIQEVEVKTGGYQAEYGRNTGGVVNVITKSGGNEFHGGVFGYYNDTGHARRPEERRRRQLRRAGLLGDGRRAVPEQRPREGRASGVGRRPRRLRHQGQGLVLRRVQPRPGQPEPPDARPDQHEHLRQPLPDHVLPEQVLGQADVQHLSGHLDRRQRLLGRADAGGRDRDPDGPLAVPVQRPPRHGRTGLRRAAEPALRLVRHLHVPVRAALRPLRHQAASASTFPSIRDYTLDPNGVQFQTTGGFGNVFGPTVNNNSKRQLYAGSFTAYAGNHEIKLGGDYQKDSTSGATYYTGGQRLRIRPCLQTGSSVCDLAAGAVLHEQRRRDAAGLLPARPAGRRHAGETSRSSRRRSSALRRSARAPSSRTSGASSRR